MLTKMFTLWRTRAITITTLLGGMVISVGSAEALAPAGNTAPAEIPEPAATPPAAKKHPKTPKPPASANSAQSAQLASTPSPVKDPPATNAVSQPSVAKSPGEPTPTSESSAVKAQPASEPEIEPPFAKNAEKKWHVDLSFDDYWLNAPIGAGSGGTQSGNLYGGSLSLAAPAWQERTFFDFSYREGYLKGATTYGPRLATSLDTYINELFIGFHFNVLPWTHDGKERGHVITHVGLSWDEWHTTETLKSGTAWPLTGLPSLITDFTAITANAGLGYDLVLWNPTSQSLSCLLGVRAEAVGAMGGSSYDVQNGDQVSGLALYGLARSTVYMELTYRDTVGVFVEGGYQQSWWLFSETPPDNIGVKEFQGYYGAFGRVGLTFRF